MGQYTRGQSYLVVVSDRIHHLLTRKRLFVVHAQRAHGQSMSGVIMRPQQISILENGMTKFAFVFKQRGNDASEMIARDEHPAFAMVEQVRRGVAGYLKGAKRSVFEGAYDAGHFLTTQGAGVIAGDGAHSYGADGAWTFVVAAV